MASKRPSDALPGDWRPPGHPYLPGRTPRPDGDDEIHRIARAAPEPTEAGAWRTNPAWRAGLILYAHGYFWEAHEVWEPVWTSARPNSRERALVQGVIQLANAALKQRMGRPEAARRLAAIAASLLSEARETGRLMGLDMTTLLGAVQDYRRALDADGAALPPSLIVDSACNHAKPEL